MGNSKVCVVPGWIGVQPVHVEHLLGGDVVELDLPHDPDPERQRDHVPGANDGASGVGVLLELARVVAQWPHAPNLRIFLTDAEDGFEDCHPIAGAVYHVDRMTPAERDAVAGVVLLDMVGDPDAAFCFAGSDAAFMARLREAAHEVGLTRLVEAPTCPGIIDDHTAFEAQGMPAVNVIDARRPGTGFPPYWHTTHDTPDKLSPDMLGRVGQVVATFLDQLPP